jgi:hypothetical protein
VNAFMSRPEAFAFVAGGTVQASGGVYLERRADDELLAHCRAGDFTYILTSRQMGKSSLMIRTAERLFAEGEQPVVIDLTEFGAQTTAEQWYKGFLSAVQDQLVLRTSAAEWWDAQSHHAFAHRFTRYLREVALEQRSERLVVFVDEIDTTLRLDFTDDFFAAIRFLYQHRAADPALQRLSFVLIGVATPGDLIKDTTRTPFNIGHRIDLTDFTLDEASPLATHLSVPAPLGRELIGWILRWTAGHPYLTLRAIRSLAESPPPAWTAAAVDQRIRDLFLRAGSDSDSNLQFVRDMLTKKAFNREAVLRTYRDIRRGERVPDKELDQVASWLKLSGIVCRRDGVLQVRNTIYEYVFDEQWARDHLRLNVNWRRRLTGLAAALLVLTVLVTIPLAVYAWRQKTEAEYQARQAELQRDDANRQRVIAENSLRDRLAALGTADKPLDELRRYNPSSAAAIEAQIARARAEAEKEFADLTSKLRAERDDAVRRLASANRALALRGDRPTPSAGPTGSVGRSSPPPKPREHVDIEKVLRMYEAAYASKDVDALRRVQALSSTEAKALSTEFADALEYRVTMDKADIRVSPDGRSATVTAEVRRLVTKGSRVSTSNAVRVFAMEKRRSGWMIVSVR